MILGAFCSYSEQLLSSFEYPSTAKRILLTIVIKESSLWIYPHDSRNPRVFADTVSQGQNVFESRHSLKIYELLDTPRCGSKFRVNICSIVVYFNLRSLIFFNSFFYNFEKIQYRLRFRILLLELW